jgi:hypothetical protein
MALTTLTYWQLSFLRKCTIGTATDSTRWWQYASKSDSLYARTYQLACRSAMFLDHIKLHAPYRHYPGRMYLQ